MNKPLQLLSGVVLLAVTAVVLSWYLMASKSGKTQEKSNTAQVQVEASKVVQNYVAIAQQNYGDALKSAQTLLSAANALVEDPNPASFAEAKKAWLAARAPYQQTEVFRFGNPEVDAWEGKVNAWPLDEGMIDYVQVDGYADAGDNPYARANIIANPQTKLSGTSLDMTTITPKSLRSLHEIDGIESNVATGYHAIEFLLWGQDLHGHEPGAGNRPYTDFAKSGCTGGNCDRRGQYLIAATELLVADLKDIVSQWAEGGAIFERFAKEDPQGSLARIITGMGSLSYGELAGERTKLGLMLGDPEEEHDCFSDNTHASHYYNVLGLNNILSGTYTATDGTSHQGASILDLAGQVSAKSQKVIRKAFSDSLAAAQAMVDLAAKGQTFDVLIAPDNKEGNAAVLRLIDALVNHTSKLEEVAKDLGLGKIVFEGSDSLKN